MYPHFEDQNNPARVPIFDSISEFVEEKGITHEEDSIFIYHVSMFVAVPPALLPKLIHDVHVCISVNKVGGILL
jgi:hypothetical protein